MTHKNLIAHSGAFRIFKLMLLLTVVVAAPTVLADYDCPYYRQQGWLVGSVCITDFDAHGNYLSSTCHMDQYENPDNEWHGICKKGIDPGTCQGANCFQRPACTWQGTCANDLDCCGMNVCNLSNHRCGESSGGDGGHGGGGLQDFDNGYGESCSDDWDCDTGLHCEWVSNTCQY